jgi:ankyrin repeat protein/Cdc6-like AAA superfamily ATPase
MRLLQLNDDGEFSLVEYVGNNIPPYAILSHTWGADHDEVTFKDLTDITAREKKGYHKLTFCAEQARNDRLQHFWVDTCCIDKSSSAELAEAINSMFRWYRDAAKCYVYLSDVSTTGFSGDGKAFHESRWFTRGWTLQELLAPTCLEFFSKEGTLLGNKSTRVQEISEVTSISTEALEGKQPLPQLSIEERMEWAKTRETTREEDIAYSLLGIFDIHMPLIYGEGKEKALKRLQKEIKESLGDPAATSPQVDTTQSLARDARLGKIHKWLSAPDPSTNYQKALKQRQDGTGLWFLESEQFTSWKIEAASCLWLYGIPGCGKTILSSAILQDLLRNCDDDPSKAVVYFYFDFNDTQKQYVEKMLRSIISQLWQQALDIPASLDTLFSSHQDGQLQPSLEALIDVAHNMMQASPQIYIVLDALDECAQRPELMEILLTMARWQLQNMHLIVTSRKERDIENSIKDFVGEENSICLQDIIVDKDIQQYVQQRLSNDKSLSKWRENVALKQEIEDALMKGSLGMYFYPLTRHSVSRADKSTRFRWAVCQLDALGKCRNRATLRRSLATLPPTLDKTYDRILSAIKEEDSEYAIRILRWLTFSAQPLSLEQVAEVIAIDVERDPAFDREEVLEDPLEALDICSSLVTTTTAEDGGQFAVLAHYSVKEYLLSDRIQKGKAAQYSMQSAICHSLIAKACLGYLLQFQYSESIPEGALEQFKLAFYAAEFWTSHASKSENRIVDISEIALQLLSVDNPAYLNWIRIHDLDSRWILSSSQLDRMPDDVPAPLYYLALCGLGGLMKRLLLNVGIDVNAQGGFYGNALQAASYRGHEYVVELLLDRGADVNAQGGTDGNALHAASYTGHEQVVKLLLSQGADVNAQGGYYGNALQAASYEGSEQVVELLLDHGADVNAQGGYYGKALQAASYTGRERIVKLLLEQGADVNAQAGTDGNALQAASAEGREQVIRLLLSQGADVNAQAGYYGNALQAASYGGHEQVVELLLSQGADVEAQGGHYGNALPAASSGGSEQVVKLLLDRGVDINAQGGYYGNALQAASARGREPVVKLLLDQGANINAQGGNYGNALQAASYGGYEQVVELLLSQGADVNAQGGRYGNTLQAASYGGSEQVVKLLLDRGVDINAQGGYYGNALQAASYGGSEQVVKLLLDQGVDVNAQGGYYGNALQAASYKGRKQVAKLLLNQGADIHAQGGYYGNALQAASYEGSERLVKLLLEQGASVNAQGGKYDNALNTASGRGHEHLVKLLLDQGADLHAQSGDYGNALYTASYKGRVQVVKLLLNQGANIHAQSGYYGNALQAASARGREQVVKLLLDRGADVNAQGGNDGNALQAASAEGHEQVVKLLLSRGADSR